LRERRKKARSRLLQDGEHVFFADDQEFFTVDLDLGPGILPEENSVTSLDGQRTQAAIVLNAALASGHNGGFLADSGINKPPAVRSSSAVRLITIRS
jgi:hypothetical protein